MIRVFVLQIKVIYDKMSLYSTNERLIVLKKIGIMFLIFSMLSPTFTAFSYELPHAFWKPAARYETALESGNKYDLISAGNEIIALLEKEEKNE